MAACRFSGRAGSAGPGGAPGIGGAILPQALIRTERIDSKQVGQQALQHAGGMALRVEPSRRAVAGDSFIAGTGENVARHRKPLKFRGAKEAHPANRRSTVWTLVDAAIRPAGALMLMSGLALGWTRHLTASYFLIAAGILSFLADWLASWLETPAACADEPGTTVPQDERVNAAGDKPESAGDNVRRVGKQTGSPEG